MQLHLTMALVLSSGSLMFAAEHSGWVNTRSVVFASAPRDDNSKTKAFDIRMRDRCDQATFDAVLGSGGCITPHGGITFEQFLAEFAKDGIVGAWRFNPDKAEVKPTQPLFVENVGGEEHTFTPVAAFGGGFVQQLNGDSQPVPECKSDSVAGTFVDPGTAKSFPALMTPGEHRFQCCIHPWMRTTLTVKAEKSDK
jgi:plastocyanin